MIRIFLSGIMKSWEKTDQIMKDDIDLTELIPLMGPSINLTIRRTKLAGEEQYKKACKQARVIKKAYEKNIKTTGLGETKGRVFVERQNLESLGLFKRKKIRKSVDKEKENGKEKRKRTPVAIESEEKAE